MIWGPDSNDAGMFAVGDTLNTRSTLKKKSVVSGKSFDMKSSDGS